MLPSLDAMLPSIIRAAYRQWRMTVTPQIRQRAHARAATLKHTKAMQQQRILMYNIAYVFFDLALCWILVHSPEISMHLREVSTAPPCLRSQANCGRADAAYTKNFDLFPNRSQVLLKICASDAKCVPVPHFLNTCAGIQLAELTVCS